VLAESGYVLSDAARISYFEARYAGASVESALESAHTASVAAHAVQLRTWWGSLNGYAQAHGAWSREISVFGPRSLISFTTNPARAAYFAGPGGQIISTAMPGYLIIPQTLTGATESEVLLMHLVGIGSR
jgi:hypothetical protein